MPMRYDIIGKEFYDKSGNKFKVINQAYLDERKIAHYNVEYESGWKTIATSGHIRAGEVKDMLSPSVFGWGCLGTAEGYAKRKESRRLYYTWRNMIRRCYDKNDRGYKWYGAKGVTVCERWRRLDYFLEDITKIPGYDDVKFENSEIELDKDILGNSMIYSPETCCFVDHATNNREALSRRWHNKQ